MNSFVVVCDHVELEGIELVVSRFAVELAQAFKEFDSEPE